MVDIFSFFYVFVLLLLLALLHFLCTKYWAEHFVANIICGCVCSFVVAVRSTALWERFSVCPCLGCGHEIGFLWGANHTRSYGLASWWMNNEVELYALGCRGVTEKAGGVGNRINVRLIKSNGLMMVMWVPLILNAKISILLVMNVGNEIVVSRRRRTNGDRPDKVHPNNKRTLKAWHSESPISSGDRIWPDSFGYSTKLESNTQNIRSNFVCLNKIQRNFSHQPKIADRNHMCYVVQYVKQQTAHAARGWSNGRMNAYYGPLWWIRLHLASNGQRRLAEPSASVVWVASEKLHGAGGLYNLCVVYFITISKML